MQEQHSWMDVERRSGTFAFGVKEGREEGRMAMISLIVDLLAERDVKLDAEAEAQLRSCEDLTTLQRWARRAVHATSSAELLEHP